MNQPATWTRPRARRFWGLIRNLHEKLGATVLMVTHDRAVADSCARMVTLRDGRVVDDQQRQAT